MATSPTTQLKDSSWAHQEGSGQASNIRTLYAPSESPPVCTMEPFATNCPELHHVSVKIVNGRREFVRRSSITECALQSCFSTRSSGLLRQYPFVKFILDAPMLVLSSSITVSSCVRAVCMEAIPAFSTRRFHAPRGVASVKCNVKININNASRIGKRMELSILILY